MKTLSYFLLSLTLLASCKKDPKSSGDPHTGIYALGVKVNPSDVFSAQAVYWAEGKEIVLGDRNTLAASIAIKGSDVYVTGYKDKKAVLWKNGVPEYLPLEGSEGATWTVSFNGDDVYAVGVDGDQAAVWKNSVLYKKLSQKGSFSGAVDDKGDIHYLVKNYSEEGGTRIKYGKNDVLTEVTDATNKVEQLAVSGADVYFGGTNQKETQVYIWKNNVKTVVETASDTLATQYEFANLWVDGTDVYLFYYDVDNNTKKSVTKYWKNGTVYTLKVPSGITPAYFRVFGGKMYYSGVFTDDYTKNGAFYLVDDVIHYLSKENSSGVQDIAVKL
ncbi:MAG TPA: hypothetical protein VL092_12315 [Chitinophagaceae bacterium]|nr:hypothetical protein [Chitinophagaceae bacterium]